MKVDQSRSRSTKPWIWSEGFTCKETYEYDLLLATFCRDLVSTSTRTEQVFSPISVSLILICLIMTLSVSAAYCAAAESTCTVFGPANFVDVLLATGELPPLVK